MVLLWVLISAAVAGGHGLEIASESTLEKGIEKAFRF